jgi:hypothetical protein
MIGEHQPTPFQIKKEIRRGKSQKYAKVWAGGVHSVCALHLLAFFLKSSILVSFYAHARTHFSTKSEK